MAVSASGLEAAIKTQVEACGFKVSSDNQCFIAAIAKAVATEIQAGTVVIPSGSSKGIYKVQ